MGIPGLKDQVMSSHLERISRLFGQPRSICVCWILVVVLARLPITSIGQRAGISRHGSNNLQNLNYPGQASQITAAYRKEVERVLAEEANRVAEELCLLEDLPITESNIVTLYVTPPKLVGAALGIGNITTRHYTYFMSVGNKFSFLVGTHLEEEYQALRKQYLWPRSRMDTSAAYIGSRHSGFLQPPLMWRR